MIAFKSHIFDTDTPNLVQIVNSINAGIWEFDVNTEQVKWSAGFYELLGYQPGEIECSYTNFIENLIYHQDRNYFLETLNNRPKRASEAIYVRLLTKNGYAWFQSSTQRQMDAKLTGTFINVDSFRSSELQLSSSNSFLTETSKLVKTGGWKIDITADKLFLSEEALSILGLPNQPGSVDELIRIFKPENRRMLSMALNDCLRIGKPYEMDLKINNNNTWIKMKAVAKIDSRGKCLIIRGVLQDITLNKQRESELELSLKLARSKNKRLESFAYIVSHNLRTYTGNLQLMLKLHNEADKAEQKNEILAHINTISTSLKATVGHLSEIVKIDNEIEADKVYIELNGHFENVLNGLQTTVEATNAVVNYDFSKCQYVQYIPAYLESIFHNLLTNALKYRDPNRQLIVNCESRIENNYVCITFEDNGLGIDLEKYGHKVFGLYQTFHQNQDAQGVGLYITRTQIEALGGSISIESAPNLGTKFIIKLYKIEEQTGVFVPQDYL